MIIVLDGPEKVGKTTLACALVDHWPEAWGELIYRHWSTSWPDEILYQLKDASANRRNEVWDRSYFSELVYSELLERPRYHPVLDPLARKRLDSEFKSRVRTWILTGNIERLHANRDQSDLCVDVNREQALYAYHAGTVYGQVLHVDLSSPIELAEHIILDLEESMDRLF